MTDATREREVKGLMAAMKYLELSAGTIITYDDEDEINENGFTITMTPCWKWLLLNAQTQ